jgi:SAM-dependent methyltransferase
MHLLTPSIEAAQKGCFMPRVSPLQLDSAADLAAKSHLLRRFGWLRQEVAFLDQCLLWQARAEPRPNFYFRWHLPRLTRTCQFLTQVAPRTAAATVLDLACFPPYSLLMEDYLKSRGLLATWTRTSLTGETERFVQDKVPVEVPTVACELGTGALLPFPSESFDLVLLTEVLEHLYGHPQQTLLEIHRILRPNGVLVLTTPNSSSWKKIHMAIDGMPQYDSPTFGGSWGHRYEFSYYDLLQLFRRSGYSVEQDRATDVYFDDPTGFYSWVEFNSVFVSKFLTGQLKRAVKLWKRRGSGLFFAGRRVGPTPTLSPEQFVTI